MSHIRRFAFGTLAAVLVAALGFFTAPALSQWAAITTNSITQADTSRAITVDGGTAGVKVGSIAGGYAIKGIQQYTVTVTPAEVATIVCVVQSITVTGVAVGDNVIGANITPSGNAVGVGLFRVSAANTITGTYCNPTAGALTPAAGPYVFTVLR